MSFDFKKYPDRLFFVPLGGSNEIGMNLNLYTIHGKWLMVDCGIGFANDFLPGVEVVVPDISFIAPLREHLVGMVITHAHEDHLGAVAYLWRDLECPIIATKFTASLLKHKFAEMGVGKKPDLRVVETSSQMQLGPFSLDLIGVTHSIPEMQAVAITTSAGTVMHTGDWKFDEKPQIGPASDYAKLKAYGDKGVLAMVCDSTNVFVEGHSGSEETVREHLTEVIRNCKERVVVTTFASNIARLETVVKAAEETGRVISLAGRSMWRMIETAQESGYLKEQEFVDAKEIMNLPKKDVLILCTGNQGEPRAALTRMARDDHPYIRLSPRDTVIMSSRKIPGNETRINHMVNLFVRKGVEVITDRNFYIHVSGHPARDELKKMYELVRPKIAIPTHGEAQHIHEHAKFARAMGVKETLEMQNGAVALIEEGDAHVVGHVEHGLIAVDGSSLIPIDGHVIRTRRKMRDDGVIFISLTLGKSGQPLSEIQMTTPGILDPEDDRDLIREYRDEVQAAVENLSPKVSNTAVEETIVKTLRRLTKRDLDKRPMVFVHLNRA